MILGARPLVAAAAIARDNSGTMLFWMTGLFSNTEKRSTSISFYFMRLRLNDECLDFLVVDYKVGFGGRG